MMSQVACVSKRCLLHERFNIQLPLSPNTYTVSQMRYISSCTYSICSGECAVLICYPRQVCEPSNIVTVFLSCDTRVMMCCYLLYIRYGIGCQLMAAHNTNVTAISAASTSDQRYTAGERRLAFSRPHIRLVCNASMAAADVSCLGPLPYSIVQLESAKHSQPLQHVRPCMITAHLLHAWQNNAGMAVKEYSMLHTRTQLCAMLCRCTDT